MGADWYGAIARQSRRFPGRGSEALLAITGLNRDRYALVRCIPGPALMSLGKN
jgi:hypothetical protein